MPKRRREDEDDEKREERKIRKLERRLERYRLKKNVTAVSPSPQSTPTIDDGENKQADITDSEDPELEVEVVEDTLPEDVLMALGDYNPQEKVYGEVIHEDISKRMVGILLKGIPKEEKEIISKNLTIPSNMMLLDAPRLNVELNAILTPSTKNRDKMLEGRQQDLGLAGASVLYAIHKLSQGDDTINIIKTLGEASRLLCNIHYEYTNIRKKLISPHLNKSLSLNLKENTRSEYLYTKLEDTVKSLSAIKRASSAMKPKPHTQVSTWGSKNYYQTPRRTVQGPQARGAARGGSHQFQQRYQPRPALRGQGRRLPPPTSRGRAKYP